MFFCKKEGHNILFCRKIYQKKEKNEENTKKGKKEQGKMCAGIKDESESESEEESPQLNAGILDEDVLLQTTWATISNPKNNEKKVVGTFLDGGCQLTILENKTANEMGLVPIETQIFKGSGIFRNKIKKQMPIYSLNLHLLDGQIVPIYARGADDVTQRIRLCWVFSSYYFRNRFILK